MEQKTLVMGGVIPHDHVHDPVPFSHGAVEVVRHAPPEQAVGAQSMRQRPAFACWGYSGRPHVRRAPRGGELQYRGIRSFGSAWPRARVLCGVAAAPAVLLRLT